MKNQPLWNQQNNKFWHPPLWKWGLVLVLVACCAFLLLWRPSPRPVKVELLPFTDSRPAWDGSYPYAMISPVAGSSPPKFETSISSIQPTVRHDSPVNDFLVDLHTGRFELRQTDLFVPDVMPLSLTRTYIIWDYHSRAFGVGGNHPYDICPTGTRLPYTYMDLNLEDWYQVHMPRAGSPLLFWHNKKGYAYITANHLLRRVLRRAGLKPKHGRVGPRIHDVRRHADSLIMPTFYHCSGWRGPGRI